MSGGERELEPEFSTVASLLPSFFLSVESYSEMGK